VIRRKKKEWEKKEGKRKVERSGVIGKQIVGRDLKGIRAHFQEGVVTKLNRRDGGKGGRKTESRQERFI